MASLNSLSFLFVLAVAISSWAGLAQSSKEVQWANSVARAHEEVTTLRFYLHDKLSGKSPSSLIIAQASQAINSSTHFGSLFMTDDPLTVGPDPSSKVVGRARGMYGSAGLTDMGLLMVISYGFTDGIYNGSSFSLLGLNPVMQPVRELPVAGGTGLFRFARGYATSSTYRFDPATGDTIVEYNVTIAAHHDV